MGSRILALAGLLALCSVCRVYAITWEFAADNQGWHARDGQCNIGLESCAPLRSAVADSVWRLVPVYNPNVAAMVELVSPPLDQAASLFDRLEVRLRVVHAEPVMGQLGLYWEAAPGEDGLRESDWWGQLYEPVTVLTGDWQTLSVAAIPEHAMTTVGAWSGVLQEIRIRLVLSGGPVTSPAGVPEMVEIDRIRLTGVAEQLRGELPPPESGRGYYGTYLREPDVYHVRRGAGQGADYGPGAGALVDLNSDGWLDVLAGGGEISGGGWMHAMNDGAGRLGAVHVEMLGVAGEPGPDRVVAADLNGDALVDVVVMDTYSSGQILYNGADEGWEMGEALSHHRYLGDGDMEGDGDADLWFQTGYPEPLGLEVLLAGEPSGLRRAAAIMQPPSADAELTPCPRYLAGNLSGDATASVVLNAARAFWPDQVTTLDHASFTGYQLVRWVDGSFAQEPIGIAAHPGLVKSIGDFDQDGDLDFVLGNEMVFRSSAPRILGRGLSLVLAQPDGSYRSLPWLDEPLTYMSVAELKWTDLDGDGVLDVVFPDRASTGPALMVCLGQADGTVPVVEGRYELGGTPEEAFVGDVDNDGDVDVVVLESTHGQDGGVEVFLNRVGERSTAVCACGQEMLPTAVRLGACYPNPFNAGTVIPVTVPAGAGSVRLTVYNALGQPVRTLVNGALSAGIHAINWDGRDAQGASVGSGTYLCRLEVAGQVQALRLTKLK